MKKRILLMIPCVAIAVASVIGVGQFDSENLAENDLLMENVEALTLDEVDNVNSRMYPCALQLNFRVDGKTFVSRYCGDCLEHTVTKVNGESYCRL